jgi:hypothetical protein
MNKMYLGLITNSWEKLFGKNDFSKLIKKGKLLGAKHIELRQHYLDKFEVFDGGLWRPQINKLEKLVSEFPDITFNLAINWPFLSKKTNPLDHQFQDALKTSKIVGKENPHLRIVDSTKFNSVWNSKEQIPKEIELNLIALSKEAIKKEISLSIENVGQTIQSMSNLVWYVRDNLPMNKKNMLSLCLDPVNQIRRFPESDPLSEMKGLPTDMFMLVHFKQSINGVLSSIIKRGDIDCKYQLKITREKKYDGPIIIEIPPHDCVFQNTKKSINFLFNRP